MFLTMMAMWCDHLLYQAFFYGGRIVFSILSRGISWLCETPTVEDKPVIKSQMEPEARPDVEAWEYV